MARQQRREPATELVEAMREDEARARWRPMQQAAFPFVDDDASTTTRARRANARSQYLLRVHSAMDDVLVLAGEIAEDRTQLCRCLNQAACDHWASEVARKYRRLAAEMVAALEGVMGPSTGVDNDPA